MTDIGDGQDAILQDGRGPAVLQHLPADVHHAAAATTRTSPTTCAPTSTRSRPDAYAVIEAYRFDDKIDRLDRAGILYQVLADFADLDLRPTRGQQRGDGLHLRGAAAQVLGDEQRDRRRALHPARGHPAHGQPARSPARRRRAAPRTRKPVRTVYDPAAGTGGMLMAATHHLKELNPDADRRGVRAGAQPRDVGDRPVRPDDAGHRPRADAHRQLPHRRRVRHRAVRLHARQPAVRRGLEGVRRPDQGRARQARATHGRFGAGLPRVSDGSFLFLQHMLQQDEARPAPASASSCPARPLFSGQAGSGESEIRRWILENDWLEGIVALPDQMFYNTGISTYVWILTNRKAAERRAARSSSSTPATSAPRCASPSATSARSSPPTRSTRSPGSTAGARGEFADDAAGEGARRTRPSASSGSPSNARCAAAGRSPPRPSPMSRTPRTPARRAALRHREGPAGRRPWADHRAEEGVRQGLRRRRPRRAHRHRTRRQGRARPRPARPGERAPARRLARPRRGRARQGPRRVRRAPPRRPRSTPTSPTPGSTTPRPRSASRSPSPASSTSTPHRDPSRRSPPRSRTSKTQIQSLDEGPRAVTVCSNGSAAASAAATAGQAVARRLIETRVRTPSCSDAYRSTDRWTSYSRSERADDLEPARQRPAP